MSGLCKDMKLRVRCPLSFVPGVYVSRKFLFFIILFLFSLKEENFIDGLIQSSAIPGS